MIPKVLTAVFSILVGLGVIGIITGSVSLKALPILFIYLCCALALNNKGGNIVKVVAKIVCYLLATSLFAALYILVSPLFGEKFEPLLFFSLLIFGALGFLSVLQLKTIKTNCT